MVIYMYSYMNYDLYIEYKSMMHPPFTEPATVYNTPERRMT